jgi:alpha-L-arabinofuranosidase
MKHSYTFTVIAGTLLAATACSYFNAGEAPARVSIDFRQRGAPVASSMYGIFFEEINHAGDGGLYAELVQNRGFEEKEIPAGYSVKFEDKEIPAGYSVKEGRLYPEPAREHLSGKVADISFKWQREEFPGWTTRGGATIRVTKEHPLYPETPNNLEVRVATAPASLVNSGFWGMNVREGESYLLRFHARAATGYRGEITARLLSGAGEVLAAVPFEATGDGRWREYTATMAASGSDAAACLALEFSAPGTVWIDYVSLFPGKTFHDRPNGLREDIATFLAGLRPAFVRWPGGCVVEGITLSNRHEWKKTLGDPARRPGQYDTWGYRCTYGFGYHEFLQFCEDVGAGAMFVCNVGLGCQYRAGDACDERELPLYLDDALDAIEYALGDPSTEWGARRAAAGHPEPFPLRYVEIGNENWGRVYDARFDLFYAAIKERYPTLTLISNHGLGDGVKGIRKTDMIDPHWYARPDFFFDNTRIFDAYPREGYTVYVGEYACNQSVGGGNMLAALSEAAFISGMERNGDLVTMCSYAPLLENRNDREWPVNLIWFDAARVVGRSSYYVQQMYAGNRPDYNLHADLQLPPGLVKFGKGGIGLGSYATRVEFKDISITTPGGSPLPVGTEGWEATRGEWGHAGGLLAQRSLETMTLNRWRGFTGERYTLSLKARKIAGDEGFFIYFGMSDDNRSGYFLNVAGWGNSRTALETLENGRVTSTAPGVAHALASDTWYDVRLVVDEHDVELFVDGVSLYTHRNAEKPRRFVVAGYDEERREVILKVINARDEEFAPRIEIAGVARVAREGRVITLAAASLEEENSFEEPLKIVPEESIYSAFSPAFSYRFKPNSFTILRLKVEE